jgi:Ser/Thr protein kinase RdoA (MazF antagonist)
MSVNAALEYAFRCYGFKNRVAESVNSGSNKVYRIRKGERTFYIRISTRDYDCVRAEIDWMLYFKGSINAPALYRSKNGRLIETYCGDGKSYVICVYYELAGVFWNKNDAALWNETIFFNWGKTMGKMHRMTKSYRPPDGLPGRPMFENRLVPPETYISIRNVYDKMVSTQSGISKLPRDADSYGLIHSDLDPLNFLIEDNDINVLDFDDCQYGFFSLDAGIALYHAIWWGLPDDDSMKNDFAFRIIGNFMSGYETENRLSDFWLRKIFLFMLYRQIDALRWHLSYYKPASLDEIVYNDLFGIHYDFGKNIRFIENDIFYDGCLIGENSFAFPRRA